ncbi:MAG: hypothetical protein GY864_05515 [Desulfobacterales bacterium]|nr:hypothetical protein [Desulfobacterales bacterium]
MNSYKSFYLIVPLSVITFILWSSSGFGYNEETEHNTLKGVEIFDVVVDWKGSGIEDGELISDKETIQKIVEQQLGFKGIKVSRVGTPKKQPFLYIEINSYTCADNLHTLHVAARVMQNVFLNKEQSISCMSPTWSSGGEVCLISAGSLGNAVLKQVDEFASAYLSVNPRDMDHTDHQKGNITPRVKPHDTGAKQGMISVDELLKIHASAVNYDKMKSVNTMKLSGRMIESRGGGEVETPYTLILMRPGYSRFDFTVQGVNIVMAYDGSTVWQVNPLRFRGSREAKIMEATEAKQIIIDAQLFPAFSSPLIEYKERGNTVEVVGIEDMNGSRAYKLMATLKFGMATYWYISTKNYLIPEFTWLAGEHDFGANGFDVHVRLKEYKETNGIIFPHIIEDKVAGFTAKKYAVDHAEINVEVDESIFKMPKKDSP